MSGNTLKFDDVEFNKKAFHASKQSIGIHSADSNIIVIFDKFKHNDRDAKYFIGYANDDVDRPLYVELPQMNGCRKYFDNGGKNMSPAIEDGSVLIKYNKMWNKITETLGITLHSMPVYDEKHIKTKAKTFDGVVNTVIWSNKIPKEGIHYTTCIAAINIDSVMKMDQKDFPQAYLEECRYEIKKEKMVRFIDAEFELDDSDSFDSE